MILLCLLVLFVSGWSLAWIFPLVTGGALAYAVVLYRQLAYPRTFDQLVENSTRRSVPAWPSLVELGCQKGLLVLALALGTLSLATVCGFDHRALSGVTLAQGFCLPLYTDVVSALAHRYVLARTA